MGRAKAETSGSWGSAETGAVVRRVTVVRADVTMLVKEGMLVTGGIVVIVTVDSTVVVEVGESG